MGCLINIQCSNNANRAKLLILNFAKYNLSCTEVDANTKKKIQVTFLARTSNRYMKLVM